MTTQTAIELELERLKGHRIIMEMDMQSALAVCSILAVARKQGLCNGYEAAELRAVTFMRAILAGIPEDAIATRMSLENGI